MNCKPGDLAVIVRPSNPQNIGKIVRVIECKLTSWIDGSTGYGWSFEGPVMFGITGVKATRINDDILRPIRDQPGQDESLTWAPKPEKVTA